MATMWQKFGAKLFAPKEQPKGTKRDETILREVRPSRCGGARRLDSDGAGACRAADRDAVAGI
jgi:hypothetical protein